MAWTSRFTSGCWARHDALINFNESQLCGNPNGSSDPGHLGHDAGEGYCTCEEWPWRRIPGLLCRGYGGLAEELLVLDRIVCAVGNPHRLLQVLQELAVEQALIKYCHNVILSLGACC